MIDNVVRRGRLADDNAAREDPNVQGARDVIEVAGKDDRLMSTSMIQTVGEKNYDGFLICIVK
jgi:predicted O-methyltransferase YrrM